MQDLGKILMIPKGDYEGLTTYEFLDVVNHNESSWICKKECRGQEPSDANVEYWQKIGTAVDLQPILNGTQQVGNAKTLDGHEAEYFAKETDLSNYKKKALTGTLPSGSNIAITFNGNSAAIINIRGSYGDAYAAYLYNGYGMASNRQRVANILASARFPYEFATDKQTLIIYNDAPSNCSYSVETFLGGIPTVVVAETTTTSLPEIPLNDIFGTARGNLPLSGGKISGAKTVPIVLENTSSNACYNEYRNKDGLVGYLGFIGKDEPIFINSSGANNTLLHTGNKPTGTYTGNGDATSRTIATNGVGDVVMVFNNTKGFAIITKSGTVCIDISGNVSVLATTEAKFNSGTITLATTNAVLNASGTNYNYQVL